MTRIINEIVIHHSATPSNLSKKSLINSFNNNHKDRLHKKVNSLWFHIAYHHLIFADWEVFNTRNYESIWYHASNYNVNKKSIWICLVWNFDEENPTMEQYLSLSQLIANIKWLYDIKLISPHNKYAKKTCPWKNFDFTLIDKYTMINKYVDIAEEECSKTWIKVLSKMEWDTPLSEADVKALINIWISRFVKDYFDDEVLWFLKELAKKRKK